jgi:hypothetical protein
MGLRHATDLNLFAKHLKFTRACLALAIVSMLFSSLLQRYVGHPPGGGNVDFTTTSLQLASSTIIQRPTYTPEPLNRFPNRGVLPRERNCRSGRARPV